MWWIEGVSTLVRCKAIGLVWISFEEGTTTDPGHSWRSHRKFSEAESLRADDGASPGHHDRFTDKHGGQFRPVRSSLRAYLQPLI